MTTTRLLHLVRNFLAHFALLSLLFEQFAFAAELPITVDGSTNTSVDRAANNVPLVNIAAPNSSGLSHNKFTDYNVNSSGLILNNAIGNSNGVVQTQIGGLINDNANLRNSGAALVILNEVTSSNVSRINGYTEIAGKKADLILANPNGFVMNGSGFINVSKLTAVVGSSNQVNPNPSNLTFSLSQVSSDFLPALTISGIGLDLENITSTDLVANVMNIVAPIYGGNNEVNLRAGDQTFNYLTKTVTSDNSAIPREVAIDASAFGKIQAGKIFIIATKEGFGIKYSADLLASRNGITIDAQGNIEYNNIASEIGDISVTSRKGSITQSGISQTTNSANSIALNAFTNIANYGTITAGRDLSLEAKSITNSKELVAGRNLTLTAAQITNEDSIYANNKITITATDFLTNKKDIISLGSAVDDGVTVTAKTLNNNKQIAAKKNVTINSESLNNNTANSLILSLNNINLNVNYIDNSSANIQAKNNLTLRNLSSETVSVTNIGGAFFAENLLDFDLENSNYTIVGTLESAKDLKIKANNIANQTTLQSGGYIEINASDKFTNGALSADNSNTKIVSGTYLNITAQNLLSNYATLSSGTDLTLTSTSGNINNNINAEIIGGIGLLTLSAKNGTVNQNSLHSLVSNGDLTLDVTDFVNTGRVDIDGDFTLNVSNDLINEERAMIFASGDMNLNVVNNLTNNYGAVIYAEGNLTIQKYALTNPLYDVANNKTASVVNYGNLETYIGGNIAIKTLDFTNSRTLDPVTGLISANDDCSTTAEGLSCDGAQTINNATNHDLYDWGSRIKREGWGDFGRTDYYKTTQGSINSASKSAVISSGGFVDIDAGNFTNYVSEIYALGNITITADEFANTPFTYGKTVNYILKSDDPYNDWCGEGRCYTPSYTFADFASYLSYIKSGGSLTITKNGVTTNSWTNGNEVDDYTGVDAGDDRDLALVNNLDANLLEETGTINLNLANYFSGPDTQGLFQKSTNPNGPLFETRSQFIDQSKFFGSDYFYTRIGLNLTDVQTQFELQSKRLVGDQFFQTKIIEEQLRTIAKNSLLLSKNENNVNNEIKTLLDNAADEYARLGLTTNDSLTQAQINSLEKDIIWFETKIIDGSTYIVPTIYLTQATRDALKNGDMATKSTIFAQEDVTIISSGGIVNAGSIAGNNVTLTSSNNIINKNFSDITALNDLSITSTAGSISNFSNLKATNALSLTAAQDITNSATILTNAKNLLDSGNEAYLKNNSNSSDKGNISSTLIETANINAGTLTINAGNNFNNYAANITTTGNAEITAGNDVNIESLQLRNRTEKYWGHKSDGGSIITDTTSNSGSNFEIGGNLNLTSLAGDINVIGSKLNSDRNLTLVAADDVKIAAAQDTYFKEKTYHKKGLTVVKNSMSVNQTLTNVKSELNSDGDISITSGSDTNLIGAKLNAANATINAGKELNIFSVADQNYSYATASKSRNFSAITKFVAPLLAPTAKLFEAVPVPVIGNMYIYANSLANNDFSFKSNLLEKNKITNQSSDINVVGNLTLTSNTDLNIKGSNLNGEETASVTSNTGDINIYNAVDLNYSRSESRSSKTTWISAGAGLIQATAAGISSTSAVLDYTRTSDQKWKDIQANNEASKNAPQKTETNININSNETLISSNLIFNNINLSATEKNTNITSSNLSASNSSTITSGGSTNILTAVENDYTYTLNEKKTPSIAAALSNSVVKIFNDAMPSFGRNKSDNTDSNNEIDELVYDQDKSKVETTTKTNIASNIFSTTGDLTITSQNNNLISGSNLSAGNNINVTSNSGTTIITSAADQSTTSTETTTQDYNDISTNYNRGRASVDSTSNVTENTTTTTTATQKQSILSATNNIAITSNKDLNILSSNLSTNTGEVSLTSQEGNVNILALADTISKTSETKTGTLTLSAGIGNSHVDTAYAEYDLIQATKALVDAKKNLNHMETLQKNGQASKDAVEDAKLNLTIATINLTLAELKLAAAAAKSAASANSLWTGFYGDLRLSIAGAKTNRATNTTTSVASNINSNGNLIINSGLNLLAANTDLIAGTVGNTTITGSNISSTEGDINIESKNNTVINASKDTYNSSTITKAWESNITLGSTAGSGIAATLDNAINALQVSLSMSLNRSKSDTASTTYNNSNITAQNGNINVTSNGTTSSGSQTGGDTTISGGNILGQDVNITSNGNLTVESLQNSYTEKSKSFGLNFGGGTGNTSGGINYSSNKTDRIWTDNQTSILGTNSVTINTSNNTEITGAVIANSTNGIIGSDAIDGNNLTLNTGSLTFKNLEDHYLTENFGAGFSTNIGTGINENNSNPFQNLNFYPNGSTTLSLQNGSSKKEQTTFATLGNGTLNITDNSDTSTINRDVTKSQIVTLDQITGALDVNTTLDNRLFTADGRNQVENEQKNLGSNLLTATEAQNELLLGVLPTPKTEGGLIGQIISMVAGDQRKLAVEMDETTKIKIAEANQKKEIYVITTNENGERIITFKDGSTAILEVSKTDLDDLNKNLKADLNHENVLIDPETGKIDYLAMALNKSAAHESMADLAVNKDGSLNGVMNTENDAIKNGLMQMGVIQSNTLNVLYDPTHGFLSDTLEASWNWVLGKTPLKSGNLYELNTYGQSVAEVAKIYDITNLRYVGHSGGGDRLYQGILLGVGAGDFGYKDLNDDIKSRLQVQFYGAPASTSSIQTAFDKITGGSLIKVQHQINPGDYVGESLGWGNAPNLSNKILGPFGPSLITNAPRLLLDSSPHSNYFCEGGFCGYNKLNIIMTPKNWTPFLPI